MLTPGSWLETQNFWDGFFNPGFLPALVFRTGIAFTLAGIFGLVTAVFTKNKDFRQLLYHYCANWLYWPLLLIVAGGILYLNATPQNLLDNLFLYNREAAPFADILIIASVLIFLLGLVFIVRVPGRIQKYAVVILLVTALGWMAGFEYLREIGRKPYIISGYMYSNGLLKQDIQKYRQTGFLQHARWVKEKRYYQRAGNECRKGTFYHAMSALPYY